MRLLSFLLICIVLAPIPAHAQAVVEHFVGPPIGPGYRDSFGGTARFNTPLGVWADSSNVYVADAGNAAIRRVLRDTGQVTTVAGREPWTFGRLKALWGNGTFLYATDGALIKKVDINSGAISTFADIFRPDGLFFVFASPSPYALTGNSHSLFVFYSQALSGSSFIPIGTPTVREISIATGEARTIPPESYGGVMPSAFWADETYLYLAHTRPSAGGISISRMNISNGAFEPLLNFPTPLVAANLWGDDAGHLFFNDAAAVYEVDLSSGQLSTIVQAHVAGMVGVGSTIFAADDVSNTILQIDPAAHHASVLAGAGPVSRDANDQFKTTNIFGNGQFVYAVNGYAVYRISIKTREISLIAGSFSESAIIDGRGSAARFYHPVILWANDRYIYVTDLARAKLRRVDVQTGDVVTVLSDFDIRNAWGDGNYLYVVDSPGVVYRLDLTTFEKRTIIARDTGLYVPIGIWGDATHLYVPDYFNCVVQKITIATGQMYPLAGHVPKCRSVDEPLAPVDGIGAEAFFPDMRGITGDGRVLFILDGSTIRTIDPQSGETHTIAGDYRISGNDDGAGSDGHFVKLNSEGNPLWSDGTNLYVANGALRRVTLAQLLTQVQFDIAATGGDYWKATQATGAFQTGSGRLRTASGTAAPEAMAIFSYRPNGVLVSEASVPASAPVLSGRIYAEVNGAVNTGIAIVNAGDLPAMISFHFTDASGNDFGSGTTTIGRNSQVAAFFSEAPFHPAGDISQACSFTFASSSPVGVIALRGYTNERSEFLMTTLPVAPVTSSASSMILLPHYADGGGWRTQVLLVNPTDRLIGGTVTMGSTISYSIAPRSSVNIASPGLASTVHTGAIRVSPAVFSTTPVASTVFSFRQSGVVVTESGVATTGSGRSFRLFAETGAVRTGLAFVNTGGTAGTLHFTLMALEGTAIANSDPLPLSAGERLSMFIDELPGLANLPQNFRGVLAISADVPISAVAIRGQYNERGDFLIATTPAFVEGQSAGYNESVFPHIVTGAGYTTEFLLLSTGAGARGTVDFMSQTGQSLTLPIQH